MRSHARQRAELQDGPGSSLRRRGVLQERQHRGVDLVVLDHGWRPPEGFLEGGVFDPSTAVERLPVRPGTPVRLRLVNTASASHRYALYGTSFRLVAVDGADVSGPPPVRDRSLRPAAGGRYDLEFVMPSEPVTLAGLADGVRLLLGDPLAAAECSAEPLLGAEGETAFDPHRTLGYLLGPVAPSSSSCSAWLPGRVDATLPCR